MDDHPRTDGLDPLLRPRAVAVIGASARPGYASATLTNIVAGGFSGPVYPVNPRYRELAGLPCHPSLADIPGPVDLALVVVPAPAVPSVLEDCVAAGVGAAVVYGSGFAETGRAGHRLQAEALRIATAGGMRVLGPNCMGFFSRTNRLTATFSVLVGDGMAPGSGVGYIGQSGAVGGAVLALLGERGVGLDAWMSTGNEADLSGTELLAEMLEQPDVHTVAFYLENVPRGRDWQRVTARAMTLGKSLVVLRGGRSAEGKQVAASHTGAMARPDAAFELVNRAAGVIEVADVTEMVATVAALTGTARPRGPHIGVITSSGGAAAVLVDHLRPAGLRLAELCPATTAELAALVPEYGSVANPVDVTAQLFTLGGGAFAQACRPILEDDGVDALTVVLTTILGELAEDVARDLVELAATTSKPIGVIWLATVESTSAARRILRDGGIPVTASVAEHVAVLRNLRIQPAGPPPVPGEPLPAELDALLDTGAVTEHSGGRLLEMLGIPRPESVLVTSAEDAEAAADRFGGPVVLKVQSPQITHKSDVGGVRVGLVGGDVGTGYREVRAAGEAVTGADIEGVLVQPMQPPGVELIVGARGGVDGYPATVTVGIGGVATELYADVVSALAPLDTMAAAALLRSLHAAPLLTGFRGAPAVDVIAAATAVARISRLAASRTDLAEIEINPLRVFREGVSALDLVVRMRNDAAKSDPGRTNAF